MTRDKASREKFVKKVRKLIRKNGLDGVDYNWYISLNH
jgi:GH18 family chitinase